MRSGIYAIFAVFLLSAVTLGGCGAQSQEKADHAAGNENSAVIRTEPKSKGPETEEVLDGGMQIPGDHSFEYEIQELSAWRDEVFLFGASQGGVVSGITAAANKEKLKGLILLYPAFQLVETVQAMFPSPEEIPESYHFLWMTVGRRYFEDIQDLDVYDVIGAYDKDVLLIHGDSDDIVPLSSSERALEVYSSAELKIIPGAGHGLYGQDAETAAGYMVEYLQRGGRLLQ